jgi:hypothetical protein
MQNTDWLEQEPGVMSDAAIVESIVANKQY